MTQNIAQGVFCSWSHNRVKIKGGPQAGDGTDVPASPPATFSHFWPKDPHPETRWWGMTQGHPSCAAVLQLSTRSGEQEGFCTSQERQKLLPQAWSGYVSPKPPLCASVGIKTSKQMAWSSGLVIWGSPGTEVGKGELHSPKMGSVAAPTSTIKLESPWHSLGTATSPETTETGRHRPKCPHIPVALGTSQGSGWDAAPGKHMGLGGHIVGARGCWHLPTLFFPLHCASSSAFYSSP